MGDTPRTPTGLGRRGGRLWRDTVGTFDLRADELATLEECCRTLDTVDTLERALDGAPLLVEGSAGQQRSNPLLAELRGQRQVLAQLTRLLALGDVPEPTGEGEVPRLTPKQARAQHASRVRWSQRGSA